MEPRIQYAKTKDGVSVAFYAMGQGTAFVEMPPMPFSHTQMEWQIPEWRRWHERLARNRKLIRYDNRGSGLSERNITDHSLDAHLLDLEAVTDRLGLERFSLFAIYQSGPVAIAYAARNPERVSHLLLWHCWARTLDIASPQLRGLRRLLEVDWRLYTESVAHEMFGWSGGEPVRRQASLIHESVAQETAQAFFAASRHFDVSTLLPRVRCPTLVLHRRLTSFPQVDVARRLASSLPDASLALLEGASGAIFLGDMESAVRAIDEFLAEGEEAPTPALAKEDVHTILFTDVEASTSITDRLGDAKARDVLRTHERIVRDALRSHGGSEVKTMGDGFMASFSSATKALECAIAVQRSFEEHNQTAEEPIKVRVGLNAGEPIAEEEDLFGTAVIVAARIAAKAEGGEILAANVVRELAAGKGFLFADRGDTALRGFEDPVRLFEVSWREEG